MLRILARSRMVLVVGAAALTAAACSGADPTATSVPTATPAPTASAARPPATATAAPPTAVPVAVLAACGAPNPASTVQTPVPTTPTAVPPTATPAGTPTPRPPTPTARPAPTVDRVGFPENYLELYKQFFVFDRIDAKSIQVVCANDIAASVKKGEPFPYGSVLVFATWRPKEDASGNVVLDANGHLIRQSLNTIFVQRKEPGFGEAYGPWRSGEWEYVAYRPDKTVQTAPANTNGCAACHLAAAGKDNDFVFRTELFHTADRYGQTNPILTGPNDVGMSRVSFQPGTRTVKVGTAVKWTNSIVDKTDHNAVASDASFNSGVLKPGQSFSFTFTKAGTFPYTCTIHPDQMRGTIRVTE